MMTVTLPWPPSVNKAWRPAGRGRRILAPEVETFRAIVVYRVHQARGRGELPWQSIAGRLSVSIVAHPPTLKRARDLDNLGKVTLDSLTKAQVWGDDSQIDLLTFRRSTPVEGGSCIITIEPLPALAQSA